MKLNQSHIAKQRETFAKNESFIIERTVITEYDYNNQIFITGCLFLEELYGDNEFYYQKIAYSKSFWNWWLVTWKGFEAEFLHYVRESNLTKLTKEEWQAYMYQIIYEPEVEQMYHNQFLKFIYDGRL